MKHFFKEEFTFDRTSRIVFFILLVILIVLAVKSIWSVLLPFLLAGIFAYVILPIVKIFQYKLHIKSRVASVLIVFVLIIGLVIGAVSYLIPSIQSEISKTMVVLSQYDADKPFWQLLLPDFISNYFNQHNLTQEIGKNISSDKIIEAIKSMLGQLNGVITGTISVFSWGVVFLMGIAYFVFILIDFESLVKGFVGMFPTSTKDMVKSVLKEVDFYMNSYFRGQVIVALCVALLLSIGFNIIGLPMATALGIFIGILNFVPYMQLFGLVPLALMCVVMSVQKGENVFWCLLLGFGTMAIVQIIQDTLIFPRIMGKQMGMKPSLILLSLAVWGSIFGFFGILVALPLSMILYSIYKKFIVKDQQYIAEHEAIQLKAPKHKKK